MFEVASFDIGYNCILGRHFLLRFMTVIHTAYATIKMPSPRGVITLKSDQRNALACENAALIHARRFGEKEAQVTPEPLARDTPKMHVAKKGTTVTPTSTQCATDRLVADERKGAADKEI
jgi:hypothetical protein